MDRLIRPYGIILDGRLELGVEVVLADGIIQEIRPHTGIPDDYVVSPAFVNAHSHLEYRGMLGKLHEREYWPWIRAITAAKAQQTDEEVANDCLVAARENRATGVALIGEHSDRPFSASAMKEAGLDGVVFQEVITRFEANGPSERLAESERRRSLQAEYGFPSYLIPHAYQTVDEQSLASFGASTAPFSMHVAETDLENQLTASDSGAIAETLAAFGVRYEPSGKRLIPTLGDLGLLRPGAQFVHCCAVNEAEVELMGRSGITVAHCPRSNRALNCPVAPVRQMLDAYIPVGLGLDSAASSGPIDMFAEMQAALEVSGYQLTPQEVWQMATTMGARSLSPAMAERRWSIAPSSQVPLIALHVQGAQTTEDLIERGTPDLVEWL